MGGQASVAATSMDWDKVDWGKLSPQEAHRMRHRMMEEKHKGHDLMHAEMILILFSSIIVAQILLFTWRQKRPRYTCIISLYRRASSSFFQPRPLYFLLRINRSYQTVTLLGLWLIPLATCMYFLFWRMLLVWTIFSAITVFVVFKATRKRISVYTPRSAQETKPF